MPPDRATQPPRLLDQVADPAWRLSYFASYASTVQLAVVLRGKKRETGLPCRRCGFAEWHVPERSWRPQGLPALDTFPLEDAAMTAQTCRQSRTASRGTKEKLAQSREGAKNEPRRRWHVDRVSRTSFCRTRHQPGITVAPRRVVRGEGRSSPAAVK